MYDRKQGRDRAYKKKEILQEIKKMKKTIVAILIITIAAFSCFAADTTKTVTLESSLIDDVFTPSILLYAVDAKDNVNAVPVEDDLIDKLDFTQAGRVNFAIVDKTVVNSSAPRTNSVAVTISDCTNGQTAESGYRVVKTLSLSKVTAVNAEDAKVASVVNELNNKAIDLTYTRYLSYAVNNVVGTFYVTWAAESTLAAGQYTANVTITYSAD
jgi:hypothetical protein